MNCLDESNPLTHTPPAAALSQAEFQALIDQGRELARKVRQDTRGQRDVADLLHPRAR